MIVESHNMLIWLFKAWWEYRSTGGRRILIIAFFCFLRALFFPFKWDRNDSLVVERSKPTFSLNHNDYNNYSTTCFASFHSGGFSFGTKNERQEGGLKSTIDWSKLYTGMIVYRYKINSTQWWQENKKQNWVVAYIIFQAEREET